MSFEEFQDLRYWNRKISAILSLHVYPMPPTKFWRHWTSFGRKCHLKIFKMTTMAAITWKSELNHFSSSESTCHSDASHHVSGQTDLSFWKEMWFEDFQNCHYGSHLGKQNGTNFSNSVSLCPTNASHQVSAQSDLRFGRRCCFEQF